VAARTHHLLEACDRYYNESNRIPKFQEDGLDPEVIATELEMSKRLVIQYVVIIDWLTKVADEAAKALAKDKEVAA
jgi:hypothetical protein